MDRPFSGVKPWLLGVAYAIVVVSFLALMVAIVAGGVAIVYLIQARS